MSKASGAGGVLVAGALALVVGGAGGYLARAVTAGSNTAPGGSTSSMGGAGRPGSGGMGGGMGAGQPQPGNDLARLVRNLAMLQKVQGKGLTADQMKPIVPLLQKMKTSEKISDADAKSLLSALEKAVEPAKETLAALSPQRGGGGGMMGGMGSGRPMAIPGSGGAPLTPGGMGGGGARPDPEKPFANERNKAALEELIKLAGG